MGRTSKSQGLAPPAIRKDMRAKQARHIVNKVIPGILAANARARRGAEGSEVFGEPGPVVSGEHGRGGSGRGGAEEKDVRGGDEYVKRKGQGRRKAKGLGSEENGSVSGPGSGSLEQDGPADLSPTAQNPSSSLPQTAKKRTIRIVVTDTITAAQTLSSSLSKSTRKSQNICILNMASPLRPGGGVLSGATSQEEFLCARTTLLPSLKEAFYRLPVLGGIYTTDVLVFRSAAPLHDSKGELGPGERFYVDVVSAGMLRFPELEGGEEEKKRLSERDRAVVEDKMRAVLRITARKGVRRLVLGAWGCGAYGNPVEDVARAWKAVLEGSSAQAAKGKKGKGTGGISSAEPETFPELEDVVFAISNRKMANAFASAFSDTIEVEDGPGSGVLEDEDDDEEDVVAQELRSKIEEMESQVGKVWNPDLKARMAVILEGLKAQLREREGSGGEEEDEGDGGVDLQSGDSVEGAEHESEDEDKNEDVEAELSDMEDASDQEQEQEKHTNKLHTALPTKII
ncbi:hypothetical protein IQ07DRAFT_517425 [Pyrenochaeta sp. DS3sAY3a]|nr:hypothetical protein IQ07DRAFT_517425 [Pyrenochaeta sp. DS3sAY3a]